MNKRYKWFRTIDEVLNYIKNDPNFQLKIINVNETSYKVILITET